MSCWEGQFDKKMKMYCWIGGDSPEVIIEHAQAKVDEGYTAVKMNATSAFEWIDSVKKNKKRFQKYKTLTPRIWL